MLSEIRRGRRSASQQAKGAVDMMQGVEPPRDFGRGGEIVEAPRWRWPACEMQDRRSAVTRQRPRRKAASGAHHAIGADLDLDDIVAAEPEVAKGDAVGDMGIGADQDGDVRAPCSPAFLDIIAGAAEHL